MIANLIGGFIAIIIGTSLIGTVATQVTGVTQSTNSSGGATCTAITQAGCSGQAQALYIASSWGASVLNLVPGFFSLGILGIGIAVTYSSLRQAGIV
jgi:hypothetical protein